MLLGSLLAALGLAAIHLLASKLPFVAGQPRSHWLSLAGGVSVAYVFVHLLPELATSQETVRQALSGPIAFIEHHVYLVALLGLAVFYGLEAVAPAPSPDEHAAAGPGSPGIFWLRIGSFAVYNAIIGYLLVHREDPGPLPLALFVVAMGLHFVVNDYALHEDHPIVYARLGRWVLAAAVLVGWGIGVITQITDVALAVLIAFLSGGVILNVLKEELPAEHQSRFWAFAAGAAAYAAILLAL